MLSLRSFFLAGIASAWLLAAGAPNPAETARRLAGIAPVADPADKAYQTHAAAMDKAWKQVEKVRLGRMRAWAHRELASLDKETYVFYPFSGPDTLHMNVCFPQVTHAVLVGLERVGRIPSLEGLDEAQRAEELGRLRASLTASLGYSFFKTNDMKVDLKNHPLDGVLPILYVYAARLGHDLKTVDLMKLDAEGNLVPAPEGATAARLTYTAPGSSQVRTLVYFSWDLSNPGLTGKGAALTAYLRRNGSGITYLKSASYLMHRDTFSTIRTFIVQNSKAVLQDDSGIPHRFFPGGNWSVVPYGTYDKPIRLFEERAQKDLLALYQEGKPKAIDFGTGYKFRVGSSNCALYILKK